MRFVKSIFAILSLFFGGACATGEWQADNVPLPAATPYDSNQMVRTAYLEGFRHGYRAQKDGGPASVELVTGPYVRAREQGFYAGAACARAEGYEAVMK